MGFLEILGNFGNFRDFRDILGILGILGVLGIFFAELLTEMCESNFFGVIMDVSTEIQIRQPKEILSANKAEMCGF